MHMAYNMCIETTPSYTSWSCASARFTCVRVNQAHLLCDIKEDLLNELELLRNVFICNGYPKKLVEKTINDSWKVELKKQIYNELEEVDPDHHEKEEKSEYFDTLHAPYIAGFSEKLQRIWNT